MRRVILAGALVLLTAAAATASAQMAAPKQMKSMRAVTNPTMLIQDRNTQFELLPSMRAAAHEQNGHTSHTLVSASPQSVFTKTSLGVAFNHSLQVYVIMTGEISFKLKANVAPSSLSPAQYPGLTLLVAPDIFVAKAQTPAEFVNLYKSLAGNANFEWVEPFVMYGGLVH